MTVVGLVTFRLGAREYATPLRAVREVVRLAGLVDLPGMTPPLAGVLDLRGTPLPVLDLREGAGPGAPGDVLVLERAGEDGPAASVDSASPGVGALGVGALGVGALGVGAIGVAVDQVRAVIGPGELRPAGTSTGPGVLRPASVSPSHKCY